MAYIVQAPPAMNVARFFRLGVGALVLGGLACSAGCSATSEDATDSGDSDLTSLTARSRELEFNGKVFVEKGASDSAILSAVRAQTQTAFGALRTSNIAVNSRELKEVDPATFAKRTVTVIDTSKPDDPGREMTEVTYLYKDDAVVALEYARRTSVPLAVMNPGYRAQTDRVLQECTANDSEAEEFRDSLWYVFEPRIASCQAAIKKEQQTIDADRAKLSDADKEVTESEVDRLYVPITAKLGADKTNEGLSYPEYQRLYSGGVKPDKLVISLLYGLIDHDHSAGIANDFNWGELMTNIAEVVDASDGWRVVPGGPDELDLSSFTLASGKKIQDPSIRDLVHVHDGSDGLGLSYADRKDLDKQLAERVYRKWLTIERPVRVSVGGEPARDFGIQLLVYFGAESDGAPHHYALKNSDVFLYNGHSYIGYGPLDPSNFRPGDFPSTYQIFWVDGCVSYNYYEKDYYPLKEGGTKNLDLVTNGIEAPSWRSGHAMGQFVVTLLNGQNASYKDLLQAATDTDPLRVVDGEVDNQFSPERFPITISNR
jgi:hypothetical protein